MSGELVIEQTGNARYALRDRMSGIGRPDQSRHTKQGRYRQLQLAAMSAPFWNILLRSENPSRRSTISGIVNRTRCAVQSHGENACRHCPEPTSELFQFVRNVTRVIGRQCIWADLISMSYLGEAGVAGDVLHVLQRVEDCVGVAWDEDAAAAVSEVWLDFAPVPCVASNMDV